ncbi:MAG: T9SS type A sorting domain-containing protein, partial [Bacteroidota bacterium]
FMLVSHSVKGQICAPLLPKLVHWFSCNHDESQPLIPAQRVWYQSNVFRTMQFRAFFGNSTIYDHGNNNQWDWNKLFAVSIAGVPGRWSNRLGWRCDPDQEMIELGLFAYIDNEDTGPINGRDGKEFMTTGTLVNTTDLLVDPTENVDVELILSENGYFTRAGDNAVAIRRRIPMPKLLGLSKSHVKRDGYFGGDQKTPTAMSIFVDRVEVDCDPRWCDAENQGFGRSQWYAGENYNYYASNWLDASLPVQGSPDENDPINDTNEIQRDDCWGNEADTRERQLPQFTIIEPEANVTFLAGNRVRLLNGFHAQAGSTFRAAIADWGECDVRKDQHRISNPGGGGTPHLIGAADHYAEAPLSPNSPLGEEAFFTVYPNPNAGQFKVVIDNYSYLNDYTLQIFDFTGKLVKQFDHTGSRTPVDLSHHAKGNYMIVISDQTGTKRFTEKILIQ